MTKFVFVNESENIFERFVDENISINKSSKEKLKFINNKLYNNYIGYFQFRNAGREYRYGKHDWVLFWIIVFDSRLLRHWNIYINAI